MTVLKQIHKRSGGTLIIGNRCLNFQVLACCSCDDIVHVFIETVLKDMMHGSTEKVSTSYSWHIEALSTDSTAADLGPHSSRQDTECQILLPNDWNSVEILQ